MLPRRRPGTELLAVVAHDADALATLGRVVPEVGDDVLHGAERDPVPETLLGAEDGDATTLVLRGVGAPHLVVRDGGGPEVRVIHDGPRVSRVMERGGHVRLPDTLGEPRAAGTLTEQRGELRRHPSQLSHPVTFGEGGEHRLAPAATHDLHLAVGVQRGEPLDRLRSLAPEPLQERTGVVETDADAGMPLQGLDHGQVRGIVVGRDDVPEVAHRLVVMEDEREGDAACHDGPDRSSRPRSVTPGPTPRQWLSRPVAPTPRGAHDPGC